MKQSKLLTSTLAAAALAAGVGFTSAANAELGASVAVSNMYLWRGIDLGVGSAAVSGDINISAAGFYSGVWASSGDAALGQEYDVYAGWGREFGIFSVDISAWSYQYPQTDVDLGDAMEAILTLGVGPVSASYYENLEGNDDYNYYTAALELGSFSALFGLSDDGGVEYSHFDLGYAYNDNLSFKLSKILDDDTDTLPSDVIVAVTLSLPIE